MASRLSNSVDSCRWNRDLTAAGIDKTDADGCVIHIHALRHSFGTHLSRAGVAPRVAQAAMRHSDIALTMNTYTDARLLDTAEAVEALPIARDDAPRTVAPMVAPNLVQPKQIESTADHSAVDDGDTQETEKARKTLGFTGFDEVGATRFELATSTSRMRVMNRKIQRFAGNQASVVPLFPTE